MMKSIRKKARVVGIFLTFLMLATAVPYQSVFAVMISTETTLDSIRANKTRYYLNALMTREDIQKTLLAQGIDLIEAKARIESLSDSEALAVADKINQLPTGGNAIGVIVGAALIVFLVLLLTDILGYSDVFPFVKAKK
jgi:hypothetical protein